MAGFPYVLDESVKLIRTPLSRSVQNYDSVTTANHSPIISAYGHGQSPTSSMTRTIFKMSSKYNLEHQPRQYFFYISVICMLYCVIYRLFFYYTLYQQENSMEKLFKLSYYPTIEWMIYINGIVSVICLSVLVFITILITLIRIHNQCSPENVQILLFSMLRLCVMFILNFIIIIFADSFILFTFISYVFNPSSSSDSRHVDIFWQSIRAYLKDGDDEDHNVNIMISDDINNDQQQSSDDDTSRLNLNSYQSQHHRVANEKMRRLITIHYYCMNLYINQTKHYLDGKNYNAGIFGRKQQQKAIQRLRPIIYNEYNQRDVADNVMDRNFNRFGISTPQSISSHFHRSRRRHQYQQKHTLKHHDLQIWFSVILWMPCFLNDQRYNFYWIIERLLLRIALIAILICLIYTETKNAMHLIPITTAIRCVLEVINLLNLIPFVIYDDPDFDNIAELYSSRELSTSIGQKKRSDIVREINKTYYTYCHNVAVKQQQMSGGMHMNQQQLQQQQQQLQQQQVMVNTPNMIYQSGSNRSAAIQTILAHGLSPGFENQRITPAPTPKITANNVQNFSHEDESTDYEEEDEEYEDDDEDEEDEEDDDEDELDDDDEETAEDEDNRKK